MIDAGVKLDALACNRLENSAVSGVTAEGDCRRLRMTGVDLDLRRQFGCIPRDL